MSITAKQYEIAAAILKCEIPVIKAVAAVESKGSGFLSDGRVKILFEPHIFYRLLDKIGELPSPIPEKYKSVLYKNQGMQPYGTYNEQYRKLALACSLDVENAYKATSWGKFQPLGMYYNEMGFKTILEMLDKFSEDEYQHLLGFVKMIKFRRLDDELRRKDWEGFAMRYNGANYKKTGYHTKLSNMYRKLLSLSK